MWKYVSRRVKETFERKCKVLDVRKTIWPCGASQSGHQNDSHPSFYQAQPIDQSGSGGPAYFCLVVPNRGGRDVSYVRCELWNRFRAHNNKNNRRRGCVVSDLLGAITWSGAIVFGWYASQLMCLHRRHVGWDKSKRRCWQMLQYPTRFIHSSLLSHYVLTSPNCPSVVSERTLRQQYASPLHAPGSASQGPVFDVSNDAEANTTPTNEPQTQNVDEAVAELVCFLGDTEYKMGVKSIASGNYRQAVAHLKLATSHNHPGATFNLGLCYENGLGVPKSLRRAMECYQIASSMGHPKAMFNLGVFYAQGLGGLEKDYQTAKKCFLTAASLGQPHALQALQRIRKIAEFDDEKKGMQPMTDLISEKNKAELFITAAAKFT